MTPPRPGRSALRAFLGAVAATGALLLAVVGAAPAGAHGADGTLGIEATAPAPPTIHVRTLLRYTADGHTVSGTTVTVTATGPGGVVVGPVDLADTGDGTYTGDLTVPTPGAWSVVATSTAPNAEARAEVTVPPTPVTTATTATTVRPAPPDRPGATSRPTDGGTGRDDSGDPLVPVVKYLVVVLGVAIITATVTVALRGRR